MSLLGELKLSAVRAFLGRIHAEMRAIKISADGETITVTVFLNQAASELIREDVSEAATEIVADFPWCNRINEQFEVVTGPLPREDVVKSGWIYERAEK
ncbi:MAG TPA: hypothetical protein VGH02_07875 [Rhizomicrobium sp.]|jgi:hypothetical protein